MHMMLYIETSTSVRKTLRQRCAAPSWKLAFGYLTLCLRSSTTSGMVSILFIDQFRTRWIAQLALAAVVFVKDKSERNEDFSTSNPASYGRYPRIVQLKSLTRRTAA